MHGPLQLHGQVLKITRGLSQELSEALFPVVTVPMLQNHELVTTIDISNESIKQARCDWHSDTSNYSCMADLKFVHDPTSAEIPHMLVVHVVACWDWLNVATHSAHVCGSGSVLSACAGRFGRQPFHSAGSHRGRS